MNNFTIDFLNIETTVLTPLLLNEHKGSAIRGALYHAIRGPMRPAPDGYTGFCTNKTAPSCRECPLNQVCPVSQLVATLDETAQRGHEIPRPYLIHPPLDGDKQHYHPGESFHFQLALCSNALNLFPYVVMALNRLQIEGLGKKDPQNNWERGKLQIQRITTHNPLTNQWREIHRSNQNHIRVPNLPITHAQVLAHAGTLPTAGHLTLHFLTPLRLISENKTLKEPTFRPLLHRLLTRLEQLSSQFSNTPLQCNVPALLELANHIPLTSNHTRWQELQSYSTRLGRSTPIGGLIGKATYHTADWTPFLPWLIWGTLIGIGKNTVKGDGWYKLTMGDE